MARRATAAAIKRKRSYVVYYQDAIGYNWCEIVKASSQAEANKSVNGAAVFGAALPETVARVVFVDVLNNQRMPKPIPNVAYVNMSKGK